MSRFLSRQLVAAGPPRCGAVVAALLRRLLQTPLARPLSQTADATAAAAISGDGSSCQSQTFSYLVRSCGLSPEAALSTAKKVHLKTTENPDSVLGLLRDCGCSPSQVATIVSKLPALLQMNATVTLKPKLEFLRGAGISGPPLAGLLSTNPNLLCFSLEKKIAPSLDILRQVLPPGFALADALRFVPRLDPEGELQNVQTLRRHGVPDVGIGRLLVKRPLAMLRPPDRFEGNVEAVEAMGLDPRNRMFPYAVGVMSFMSREAWERKLAVYRSVGWSDGEISAAFIRQPNFLALSDDAIRRKMDFFSGKLGLTVATLCRVPAVLLLSLEKRIVPRCAVLEVLMGRGVQRGKISVVTVLRMPEKRFLERFVIEYREEAPEVVDAHMGKVEFCGLSTPARSEEPSASGR